MISAIKKNFDFLFDDKVVLSTERECWKKNVGSDEEKCLEESRAKLLKKCIDEDWGNLIMSRKEKQLRNSN